MRAHLICFKRKEKTIMVKVSNIVVRFKLNRRLDPARLFNINNIQSKANGKLAQIKSSKMKGVARARGLDIFFHMKMRKNTLKYITNYQGVDMIISGIVGFARAL